MTTIHRLRVSFTGAAVVGPGVATFYSSAASAAGMPAAVVSFFNAIKAALPPDLTITVPGSGDDIDVASGAIVGAWTATGSGTVIGTGSGGYAQGVGCRIVWSTNGLVAGRRTRGTTFLVPISLGNFDSSNGLNEAFRTTVQTAADTMRAAIPADFVIYSRPSHLRSGQVSVVTAASIPDKVSWLRSRRT